MDILIVNIGIVACLLLIYVTSVFIFAQILKDNSVMDILYGPAFLFTSYLYLTLTETAATLPIILVICIALWATRLSTRIFLKNFGNPEDARYAAWRSEWMQKGKLYFLFRSYLQINLLQGAVILVVLLPFIIAVSSPHILSAPFVLVGTIVFLFGFAYETIADFQLDQFIARKKAGTETAKLMTSGLFKYSRRPNYFGETLIWWGQAIMVLSLPFGFLALLSPLLITYVVTKVTGPMLEQLFLKRYPEEYKAYMQSTSYFFPFPPKQ
jgi:steroid 5-alpha reductase family enzyme